MAKTKISEFDSTPANNTDIDSINIAEGCAPSGINNAIRELMSQLKDQQTGASGDNFTVGGNLAVTGTSAFTGNVAFAGSTTFTGAVTFSSAVVMSSGTVNNTTIGATTASTGAFTTLSASSTVSGTGFSNYLASPPSIGGTTAAAGKFTTLEATGVTTVQAGTAALPAITTTGDTNTGIFFPAADTIAFAEGGAESMRIDSSGVVLINTTTSLSGQLNIAFLGGTNSCQVLKNTNASNSGTYSVFLNSAESSAGFISQNGATGVSYNTSSDYRLKENIAPMTGALAKVQQLKPVTYTWKIDGSNGQGFIAHELQAVVPDCVTGEKDAVDTDEKPIYQGIDTSFLIATLTAAIQELNAKVDAQAARIAALEA